jgi:hypothetical protein
MTLPTNVDIAVEGWPIKYYKNKLERQHRQTLPAIYHRARYSLYNRPDPSKSAQHLRVRRLRRVRFRKHKEERKKEVGDGSGNEERSKRQARRVFIGLGGRLTFKVTNALQSLGRGSTSRARVEIT